METSLWPTACARISARETPSTHTQLQDQDECVGCGFCTPEGTADPLVVVDMAVRYHTAFFARELLADATVGATFADAGVAGDVAVGRVVLDSK